MITHVSAPCLLVAMPSMLDSNFARTVMLLAEHNNEGAVGFVLNRPSTVPLKSMLSVIDREIPPAIPAWYGGPIDTGTAIILHSRKPADGDTEIGSNIYLSTSGRVLDSLIGESEVTIRERANGQLVHDILNPYRFLVGYAGWGAGQLDDEIRAGSWLLHPVDQDIIFNTPWSDMWSIITTRMGIGKAAVASVPPVAHTSYLN
jgi:putative transcriptional regulator